MEVGRDKEGLVVVVAEEEEEREEGMVVEEDGELEVMLCVVHGWCCSLCCGEGS